MEERKIHTMEIEEIAFRQEQIKRQKDSRIYETCSIVLKCSACGAVVTREAINLYTGHMFDQCITYVCLECRGGMTLLTNDNKEN